MNYKKLVSAISAVTLLAGLAVVPNAMAEEVVYVDQVVDLGINFKPTDTTYSSYDLMDLAEKAGADINAIKNSSTVTVSYDMTVTNTATSGSPDALNDNIFMDLRATAPSDRFSDAADNSRFADFRIYAGWVQIDINDCSGGFNNNDHGLWNISGKFNEGTTVHRVATTIDFEKKQVSMSASGTASSSKVLESFPSEYDRDNLYFAIYPAVDDYTISNVTLTYKKAYSYDTDNMDKEEDTVKADFSFNSSADDYEYIDIYERALKAGADDSIYVSDTIEIEYDLAVNSLSADGFVDLVCQNPLSITKGTDSSRFVLSRLNKGWNQLDMVDCTTYYSGSSDGNGQCLKMSGAFSAGVINHITVLIDYKNKTITATGNGQATKTFTFTNFPQMAEKSKIYMAVEPGTVNDFTISNLTISYNKLIPKPVLTDPTAEVTDVVTSNMGDGDMASAVKASVKPNDYSVTGLTWTFTDDEKGTGTYETTKINISGQGAVDYVLYINGYLVQSGNSVSVAVSSKAPVSAIN